MKILLKQIMNKLFKKRLPKIRTITASMAAVPWREDLLQRVVESLLPQVDRLNIYLNEWKEIPGFLKHSKINAVMSQNEVGDLGDKGKFYWCEKITGFHLTVDDDILYPENYVEQLLHGLSRYPKSVVSYDGTILNYPEFKKRNNSGTNFSKRCRKDIRVALIGTGFLAYNADELQIRLDNFKSHYWADGWFSLQARKANFRCIVLRHKQDWLRSILKDSTDTLSMNRSESAHQEIDYWIEKYELWDHMTLFSERIRDRELRWWTHKDHVQNKNVGGKIKGAMFAASHGINTPQVYEIITGIENMPQFKQFGPNFVIKPDEGFSASNIFAMREGINLLDRKAWNRDEVIEVFSNAKDQTGKEKIIIEELLMNWDNYDGLPYDFKFYMFGDKIAFCHIIKDRCKVNSSLSKNWYVDEEFIPIDKQVIATLAEDKSKIEMPDCWDELVSTAKTLGLSLNRFTRIDLYGTVNGVVFGEFTPTPHGGRGFTKWADKWLGNMWKGVDGVAADDD